MTSYTYTHPKLGISDISNAPSVFVQDTTLDTSFDVPSGGAVNQDEIKTDSIVSKSTTNNKIKLSALH